MRTEDNKMMITKQMRAGLFVVAVTGLLLAGCSEDKSAEQIEKITESATTVTENMVAEVATPAPAAEAVKETVEEKVEMAAEKVEEVVAPDPVVEEAKPESAIAEASTPVSGVKPEPAINLAAEETTAAEESAGGDVPQYVVECPEGAASAKVCKVDKNTYVGWRTYATNCQVCHGGSGLGSTFAPNLMDRFNQQGVDYARFIEVVTNGFTGQMGAMPAWDKNKAVMKDLDNLYRYLQARADDKLPTGRPTRMK